MQAVLPVNHWVSQHHHQRSVGTGGARGIATSARVVAGHLLLVLPVSADESDPMVIWLEQPPQGRSARGSLISARGHLA